MPRRRVSSIGAADNSMLFLSGAAALLTVTALIRRTACVSLRNRVGYLVIRRGVPRDAQLHVSVLIGGHTSGIVRSAAAVPTKSACSSSSFRVSTKRSRRPIRK